MESTEEEKKARFLVEVSRMEKNMGAIMEDNGITVQQLGRWKREDENREGQARAGARRRRKRFGTSGF